MTSVCVLHFKYNPYGTEHRDKPEAKAESQFVCVCLAVCVCPRQSLRRSRRERRRLRRFIRLRLCEQQAMSVVSTPVLCGDVYRGGRRLLLAAIATPSPSPPCRTWCDCEGNTNTWATKCGYTASCAAAGCSACFVPQPSPPPTSPPPCTPCTDEPELYMVSARPAVHALDVGVHPPLWHLSRVASAEVLQGFVLSGRQWLRWRLLLSTTPGRTTATDRHAAELFHQD